MKITLSISSIPYWEYLKERLQKDISDSLRSKLGIEVLTTLGSLVLEETYEGLEEVKVAGQLINPLTDLLVDTHNEFVDSNNYSLLDKYKEVDCFITLCRNHPTALVSFNN